jgi:ubiquinone/menaquinone biosynthesis C-methylase UbiE
VRAPAKRLPWETGVEGSNPSPSATSPKAPRSMEELYFEIFESLPRQGPGDDKSTRKAFQKLTGLPKHPEILDVGCGTGRQTLVLAKLPTGNITALDNHQPFIATLKRNVHQAGYEDRIRCLVGDMNSMDFLEGSFDVIWSEGAANLMRLKNALHAWRPLLRPKGYMAISELVWFKKEVPPEIQDYFAKLYPDMEYYEDIYSVIKSAGYKMVNYFPLPDRSWRTDYYTPAEKKIAEMRYKYRDNKEAQTILDSFQLEMDMHKKYSAYYGYGFYIMRKENE